MTERILNRYRPTAPSDSASRPPEIQGILGPFNELLQAPQNLVARAVQPNLTLPSGQLLRGSLLLLVLYGLAAGAFEGGVTLLLAAAKTPLIVLGSLLLCLPSLYVFASLSGGRVTGRWLVSVSVGFVGTTALVMLGLVPIAWLFSVSTRSLTFVVLLHALIWTTAILLGGRFLRLLLREIGARGSLAAWLLMLWCVAFQLTTNLRPILHHEPGTPLIAKEKMFFLEHFSTTSRVRSN